MKKLSKKYSGFILITVLWILAILAALAVSLSRQAFMEVSLTRLATGKLRAKYQAWAGIVQAIELIRADSADETAKAKDTLYACGIVTAEKSLEEIFSNGANAGDRFVIAHQVVSEESNAKENRPGLLDEERLLNLNALTSENRVILKELLVLLGMADNEAQRISAAVVDWKDQDDRAAADAEQTENAYFSAEKAPVIKNRPFDALEEFALIPGVNEEMYRKAKPYLTIFPKSGSLRINFDTAPVVVLRAVSRGAFGGANGADLADAEALVVKMMEYRRGDDGLEMTADDRVIDWNEMNLNAAERTLAFFVTQYRAQKSDHFRVVSEGSAGSTGVTATIEAVVRRDDLAIVSWRRK